MSDGGGFPSVFCPKSNIPERNSYVQFETAAASGLKGLQEALIHLVQSLHHLAVQTHQVCLPLGIQSILYHRQLPQVLLEAHLPLVRLPRPLNTWKRVCVWFKAYPTPLTRFEFCHKGFGICSR